MSTKETWEAGNFIMAQMARGQVGRLKKRRAGHAQPHMMAEHMLFVQDGKRVLVFAPAHWLLLSPSATAEERRDHLHENETVNVVSVREERLSLCSNVAAETKFAAILSAKRPTYSAAPRLA